MKISEELKFLVEKELTSVLQLCEGDLRLAIAVNNLVSFDLQNELSVHAQMKNMNHEAVQKVFKGSQ